VDYHKENEIMPAYRDIGKKFGGISTNAVMDHLRNIERKGWIIRSKVRGRSRSLLFTARTKWFYGISLGIKMSMGDEQVVCEFCGNPRNAVLKECVYCGRADRRLEKASHFQSVIIVMKDGRRGTFTGPALFPDEGAEIDEILFTPPKELPMGYSFAPFEEGEE